MEMDVLQLLQRVRSLIRETFTHLGASPDACCSESMLIRGGYFCGRRFKCEGYQAVWFMEEGQVKFFGQAGSLIRAVDLSADPEEAASRKAA